MPHDRDVSLDDQRQAAISSVREETGSYRLRDVAHLPLGAHQYAAAQLGRTAKAGSQFGSRSRMCGANPHAGVQGATYVTAALYGQAAAQSARYDLPATDPPALTEPYRMSNPISDFYIKKHS